MAFAKRLSTVATNAWRRVSHSPASSARHSKQSQEHGNEEEGSWTVDSPAPQVPLNAARWSHAELEAIGIGMTHEPSVAAATSEQNTNTRSLRLEIPDGSETGIGRQAAMQKLSSSSASGSSEEERYDSDLDNNSAPRLEAEQSGGVELDVRTAFINCEDAAAQTDPDDELIEERRKVSMMEEHVDELLKLIEDCSQQSKELHTRNKSLQEEITSLRAAAPNRGIGLEEPQNQSLVDKVEQPAFIIVESLHIPSVDVSETHSVGGPLDIAQIAQVKIKCHRLALEKLSGGVRAPHALTAAELREVVEDLRQRNEALTTRLTHAESVEMQASGLASDEKNELSEQIAILRSEATANREKAFISKEEEGIVRRSLEELTKSNKQLRCEYEEMQENACSSEDKTNREKALISKEEESIVRRSLEELTKRNKQLQCECEQMQENACSSASDEKKARWQFEEASERCQQLQHFCNELNQKLAVAASTEQEATISAEEALRGFTELQGSNTRVMQSEYKRLHEEFKEIERDRKQLHAQVLQQKSSRDGIPFSHVRRQECPKEIQGANPLGEKPKDAVDSTRGLDEKAIPSSKRKGAVALLKGLRNGEVAQIVDDMEAKPVYDAIALSSTVASERSEQCFSLPMTTSLLKSLSEEMSSTGLAAREGDSSYSEMTSTVQPEVPDVVALRRECKQLQFQMATAFQDESELCKLVEMLREHLTQAMGQEKISKRLAEDRLQRCEELESECGELQVELLEGRRAITPLLQDAEVAEAWHRCELLQGECERLRSQLKSQTKEAEKAALQAADQYEDLRREHAELRKKSIDRVRNAAAIQLMLEDAASADALHRCEELKRECEQLRGKSIERAKATAAAQPLLEDAAFTNASRHCDELKRECDRLRSISNGNAIVAAANELLLEDAVAVEVDMELELWSCVETSLRPRQNSQRNLTSDCARLEQELSHAVQAEIDSRKAEQMLRESTEQLESELREARSQAVRYEQSEKDAQMAVERGLRSNLELQRTCDSLKTRACVQMEISNEEAKLRSQEVQRLYEQVARAEEAEKISRRSAEAAADLMRRKDNLRQCKQLREQVSRAVETDKEARQSAEVAAELQRLIHDLGSVDSDASSTNPLSIMTITPSHQLVTASPPTPIRHQ